MKRAFGFVSNGDFLIGSTITPPQRLKEKSEVFKEGLLAKEFQINHQSLQEMFAEIGK